MTVSPSKLGTKWPRVVLNDAVEFLDHMRRPTTASDREPGPYPYYGANGQQDSVAKYIFDEPLILLAEDGGHFGDPARGVAYGVQGKCWVNNHAHVLRPKADFDFRFLKWHLAHYDLAGFVNGTTRGKLTKGAAERIPLVKPPLPEQRRIADILDKADTIRRKRKEAIALTEELLRSAFLEMFGDPVTNPKGWEVKPLGDLGRITTGNTPSRAVGEYFGADIEWIKSDNINTRSHYLTRATEGLSDQGRAISRTVPAGSTLMTCIAGSPDCIGNVALADREVAFNQQINAVTPHEGVDHRFLYVLLLVGKRLVQAASTNSMKGMVSKGKLEAVLVPSPPLKAQSQFAEVFDRVLRLSRRQEVAQGEALMLFDTMVHRAFSGGLTP
ncbi:MAG: restriction endonuclease subunit S [Polyangiaceae bacterium]|nr:restriction endonuclease subunit S [Polyangiaceae bacterium]